MTKEIKATAPTREELYREYKRVSEENERLRRLNADQELEIEALRNEIDWLNDAV